MKNFGCYYSPISGGFCGRTFDSSNVAKECRIENGHCVLKSPEQYLNEIISVSGPAAISVGKYQGKTYYLLSDRHGQPTQVCANTCLDFDVRLDTKIGTDDTCYDITRLIDEMLTADKSMVDVYIEHPYLGKSLTSGPPREYYAEDKDKIGYLNKISAVFWPCLYKKADCPYSNLRVHYIDIRYTFQDHPTPKKLTLNGYLNSRIKNCDATLLGLKGQLEQNTYFEDTDTLIRFFLDSNNRLRELFTIILTSNDYIRDVVNLISNLEVLDEQTGTDIQQVLFNPDYIVKRKDVTLHRIRNQLYGLEQDSEQNLAQQITTFILKQYPNSNQTFNLWFQIYQTYLNRLMPTYYTEVFSLPSLSDIKSHVDPDILLVDAYTLGRIFRKFGDNSHVDSKKVIIYAGIGHIKTYVKFFTEILNVNFVTVPSDAYTPAYRTNRCHQIQRNLFL